jgi:hypothetical protein
LPFIVNDAFLGTVHTYPPPHGPEFNEILDSVWNTRGWTFQERLLSRRILYFGRHQLLWECQTCRWTEDNTNNFNMNQPGRANNQLEDEGGLKSILLSFARSSLDPAGLYGDMGEELQANGLKRPVRLLQPSSPLVRYLSWLIKKQQTYVEKFMPWSFPWGALVTEYSARVLTESKDKSLALQGIAVALSQWRRRWSYSHGLYLANSGCGLLWFSMGEPLRKPPLERGKIQLSGTVLSV